jgi:ribonuclease Z
VWGPDGTKNMIDHLRQAYEFDIRIRIEDDHAKPAGVVIVVTEIAEGVVYEMDGVKVTAFEVDHAPVKPAFGYRVDAARRSVVLSGDTRFCESLIRHAQGVDLLIHEVVALDSIRRAGVPQERIESVGHHHTTPEQAGEVFVRVRPKLAVYSHIVMPQATPEEILAPTRRVYDGPLELGEDLMVIEVGDEMVVRRPAHPSP